ARAIVETIHRNGAMPVAKGRFEGHVDERIAGSRSREIQIDVSPPGDGWTAGFTCLRMSGFTKGGGRGCGNGIRRELEHIAAIHVFPLGGICSLPLEQ